jgi:transitional endoplasmic reticulum ATPase
MPRSPRRLAATTVATRPHASGSGQFRADYLRAAKFACHAFEGLDRHSRGASGLMRWVSEASDSLGLGAQFSHDADEWGDSGRGGRRPSAAAWRRLGAGLTKLRNEAERFATRTPVAALAAELGLDQVETDILQLATDHAVLPPVQLLWGCLARESRYGHLFRTDHLQIALMTGHDPVAVAARLRASASLRHSGLIRVDADGDISVLDRVCRIAGEPLLPGTAARSALLGEPQKASLTLADFGHLATDTNWLLTVLRSAVAERARGVHVLLKGPPGTGKTELAKTLAAALGVPLYSLGE